MNILLVDEDPSVIRALMPVLKAIPGYDLRVAINGEKALENAQAWGTVDVLVTEVVMEPMNGFTLRNKLENRIPGIRTILMSSYDLTPFADQTEGYLTIGKPVDTQILLAAIAGKITPPKPMPAPPQSEPEQEPAPESEVVAPVPVDEPEESAVTEPEAGAESVPENVEPAPPEPTAAAVPAVARPVAVAQPTAIPRAAVAAIPASPATGDGMELIGHTIGNYRVVRKIGDGSLGPTFEAIQLSMNRPVALKILSSRLQGDPEAKARFIANASAKANVQHPFILSVYEAGETEAHCYYSREYVDGEILAKIIARREPVDEPTALQIVRVVAEGLAYLNQHKISHSGLSAKSIYVGVDKRPRLANLATHSEEHPNTLREIRTLSEIVSATLPEGRASDPGLQEMLGRMRLGNQQGFLSWVALLQVVKELEPKVVPADAFKLSAHDVAAIRALEAAKKRQKMQVIWAAVGMSGLLLALGFALYLAFWTNEKPFNEQVKIPAGEFIYQDGKKMTLPEFSIDQYEVTIGQYAKFLAYLAKHPSEAKKFDHPAQPPGLKTHVPKDWDIYLGRARRGKPVEKVIPIDMNCPQFLVSWWDAYAYAKWRGRELPSQEQWEKAARGKDGRLYPWGNNWAPTDCNSGADYDADAAVKGKIDKWNRWAPVDAFPRDKSPYGVIGMAGNVSEWTDSWDARHDIPVICGGNYKDLDCQVTRRINDVYPENSKQYIGFRTVNKRY